jgi:lipopolysaccharide export LptBFGC system permease protein LptF
MSGDAAAPSLAVPAKRRFGEGLVDAMHGLAQLDRIDRYVLRYFGTSLLVVFVFFFGFFMVIDLFANAGDFIDSARRQGIPARTMARWVAGYYLYKSPSVFLQVAPFVTVIGALVAVARMNRSNELIPVLMAGRSVFRMLRPLFVAAIALATFMLFVQEFVAPAASDHRLGLYSFLRDGRVNVRIRTDLSDEQGNQWSRLEVDPVGGVLARGRVRRLDLQGGVTRVDRVEFADATYDEARRAWSMKDGVRVVSDDDRGQHESTQALFPSSLSLRQIVAQEKEPFDLSFAELGQLFAASKQPRFQVLMHYHVTFPCANLLLLLLAVPFVLRYDRQRVMQGLAVAFFLCVAYFAVDAALRGMGERTLHPILAAWFAPLLFGALGITLFDGVRT